MALISDLTITGNERAQSRVTNRRIGSAEIYTVIIDGDFGGGTIAAQISFDGTNWVAITDQIGAVTFDADGARNFTINSDAQSPAYIGFNMTGATNPDVSIKIYNGA